MIQSEDGLVLKKVPDNKPGSLASPDIFIFNGVYRIEEDTNDVYLVGKDHVHAYNEVTRKFRILRNIAD